MSITFQNPAQQLIYERARLALAQMPGVTIAKHASEPSLRVSRAEHQAHVYIHAHGELEALIRIGTLVASGAQPNQAPLLRYLLEQNNTHPLGAFCLDPDGHVILEHSAVASAFDGPSLCATVDAILTTLAQTQGLIIGYITRTAELAAEASEAPAPKTPATGAPAPAATQTQATTQTQTAPAPTRSLVEAAKAAAAAQAKPSRLWLDDMGLYHCVRGLPIAVVDVLEMIEAGQTDAQIFTQHPDLTAEDLAEISAFGPAIREAERPPAPPEPEPEPEPAPQPKRPQSPSKTPRRLRLDDLGLFYCVRDLPISVDEILDLLDAGQTDAQIFADYPNLTDEDLSEIRRFGPDLRQPKEEAPPAPPAPVIPSAPIPIASTAPSKPTPAPAPAQPKRRTLKRIRLDELGIYYCIRGLPISVDEVIARLDGGATEADVLREFPALEHDDIEEVIWYRDKTRQSD